MSTFFTFQKCHKAAKEDSGMLEFISDHFKTQEMFENTFERYLFPLK